MKVYNGISLYWKCQVIGWSVASFYWGYAAFVQGFHFNFQQGLADFILDVLIGILLTHSYRNIALRRKWHALALKALVPTMIPAILLLSLLYMALVIFKLYLVRLMFNQHFPVPFLAFFRSGWLTVFITGTRVMSIWVLAYHLYHYAQKEIRTAKENARLSVISAEAQLTNLSSQLNPHFFFNSLSNIKFLVTENPGSARRAIDLLGELLRNSLYGKGDKWISLCEEISFVKDYLELEMFRFGDRLRVDMAIDDELAAVPVPPFCIQALVENAIKHGIEKRKAPGIIEVKAGKTDGLMRISVQNPGTLGSGTGEGLGLMNLRERLRLQYNGSAEFEIGELPGERILVTISIPLA